MLKFFTWLMLVDRLYTKSMLQRRHLNATQNNICVLCDMQAEEDIVHLFFGCGFSQSCWKKIGFNWNDNPDIHERLRLTEAQMQPSFIQIFIIAAWELWNLRNGVILMARKLWYMMRT
jgi:hypothetical protein